MNRYYTFLFVLIAISLFGQPDTVTIGFGNGYPVGITASSSSNNTNVNNTANQTGFLPNEAAASRFLTQATLGHTFEDIMSVKSLGLEDWINAQFNIPIPYTLVSEARKVHKTRIDSLNDPAAFPSDRAFSYPWWNYHMTSNDKLRTKVAYALSQLVVISSKSDFGYNGYALASYYDVLLRNALGNFRTLLGDVTFHPAMGNYLTHINNPKTYLPSNRFPDENYAREIMQLFTIGLNQLNMDGSEKLDANGKLIPTYNSYDIGQLAKVFTGFTWSDNMFWYGQRTDTSYIHPMRIDSAYHEPGPKTLINGYVIPDRNPVTLASSMQDVNDALDHLFNHSNTPPFVSKFLIQRLVTSNPSPAYINRVANIFVNNGSGVRGDMKAIIKAILLDEEAQRCSSGDNDSWVKLKEPLVRYMQLNMAFNSFSPSGKQRNAFYTVDELVKQRPLGSPSVFNFYQSNYKPIGQIEDANYVAPEFQLINSQSIAGWLNLLYQCLVNNYITDSWEMFEGENYQIHMSQLNLNDELSLVNDDQLHILIDRLNLILAQGRLSTTTANKIVSTLKKWPNSSAEEKDRRVKMAVYLVMASPEYLIAR
jgi:uncharacterized protein (DUF1800 family)